MVSFSITLTDPWPRFQGYVIIRRRISQKRYKIDTWLPWWHEPLKESDAAYGIVPSLLTLSDLSFLLGYLRNYKQFHCLFLKNKAHIQPEGLLHNADSDLLAIAKFLTIARAQID